MREFPQAMDCDGKATMLEDCVRRACQTAGGEVDVDLHKHVREETRAWCSGGADLDVPLAATATFPRLAFRAWDESHSAQALLRNSRKEDAEIMITEGLLVTRKKPPSLAKFLSTSTVFRNTVGLQQQEHDIAFVKNFGWAPQRFSSRARPLSHGKVNVGTLSSRRSEKNPRGATEIGAFSPEASWKISGARIVRACFLGGCWPICAQNTTLGSLQETKATPTLQQFKIGPPRSSQGWTLCSRRGRFWPCPKLSQASPCSFCRGRRATHAARASKV